MNHLFDFRNERNYTPNVTLARSNQSVTSISKKPFITNDKVLCFDERSSSGASSMSSSEANELLLQTRGFYLLFI